MVTAFYTYLHEELPRETWRELFSLLPGSLQTTVAQYLRWQDRQATLFGKLLLKEWLMQNGYGRDCLDLLTCDGYGRPRIHESIDFNISHSGAYVVCAISDEGRVGVDIEEIKPIEFDDFKETMTVAQWAEIGGSAHPYTTFFSYWTQYESVIKADGRGVSIPPKAIHLNHKTALLDDCIWFLREIAIDSDYSCHIAADQEISDLVAERVDLAQVFL
jgi:4'-phosphopantetheinyl transferase